MVLFPSEISPDFVYYLSSFILSPTFLKFHQVYRICWRISPSGNNESKTVRGSLSCVCVEIQIEPTTDRDLNGCYIRLLLLMYPIHSHESARDIATLGTLRSTLSTSMTTSFKLKNSSCKTKRMNAFYSPVHSQHRPCSAYNVTQTIFTS